MDIFYYYFPYLSVTSISFFSDGILSLIFLATLVKWFFKDSSHSSAEIEKLSRFCEDQSKENRSRNKIWANF